MQVFKGKTRSHAMNSALRQPEIAVEWAPLRFESVNPQQYMTVNLAEARASFSTPAQQIEAARRGYDDWWQALG
ncbi:MAG: hypothetical protein KDE55_22395 [Novosphingobium sp.]|nr:hypothetical protein [Novosphingobium sp.]